MCDLRKLISLHVQGRRNCDFSKPGEGPLQCATGGCIGGLLCTAPGVPPATLAEWTLGDPESGNDFYDVSLVDGKFSAQADSAW